MSTIVTRVGKGSPLTWTEVDSNFTNLNTDKLQSGNTASSLTITSATINGGSINGTTIGASTASTGAFTTLSSSGATTFTAGTASTSTTTGTAVITGGLGVSGRINAANFDGIVGANTAAAGSFTTLSATGVTTVQAGTVSLPAITTTGDTNTGIFFPAADTIAFTEGGTESMRITSTGNVGIGTASPISLTNQTRITTNGTNASGLSMMVGGTHTAFAITSSASMFVGSVTAIPLILSTTDTERMRIDSSGNVGINTGAITQLYANYTQLGIKGGSTVAGGTLQFTTSNGTIATNLVCDTNATYLAAVGGGGLSFAVGGSGTGTERMRIDSSGNVGIGTSSPGAKLDFGSSAGISGTAGLPSVSIYASGSARYGLNVSTDSLDISSLATSGRISFYTGGSTSSITERMRITAGGEVYIAGTADQGAYNLQCNGTGVWGAGAYVNGSDARIKENIVSIDSSLDVVNKLNPVTYKYKEEWSKDQSTQTGFIAQELLVALEGKNYVDGIVQQGGEYMSVAYQNIIPLLTKAIQELSAKVETLEAQLQGK